MPAPDTTTDVAGLRVFVAEDEFHVLELIEHMLEELGCVVVDSASTAEAALERSKVTEAEVAVLDVNLRGKSIFPTAELLKGRGIPILFSTGYGSAGMDVDWKASPVIQKPFATEQLRRALCHLRDKR
jgi:CheY-like chemotaxis protein